MLKIIILAALLAGCSNKEANKVAIQNFVQTCEEPVSGELVLSNGVFESASLKLSCGRHKDIESRR